MKELNELVEEFREEYMSFKREGGLTQQRLAEISGVSRDVLASFESGRTPIPNGDAVLKLVRMLYPELNSDTAVSIIHLCPYCKGQSPGPDEGACFCMRCGRKLGEPCHRCEAVIAKGHNFCGKCGSKVREEAV